MKRYFYTVLGMAIILTFTGCARQNTQMDEPAMAQNGGQVFEQQVSENSAATSKTDAALNLIEFSLDETAGGYCIIAADTAISGDLVIPDQYDGKPVVRIDERAFYNCENLNSIELPDSITEIGASAFRGCSGLTGISLPDGLKAISSDCFHGCTDLRSVDIPSSVQQISERAFYECESLEEIVFPDSLQKIDSSAFRRCNSLGEIQIPLSVERIGEHAFYGCDNITVYCEAEKRPEGWAENWIESSQTVYWGD